MVIQFSGGSPLLVLVLTSTFSAILLLVNKMMSGSDTIIPTDLIMF